MKLGLGLYQHSLTNDNFQFAKQAGCSHIVVHLVDYYHGIEGLPFTDKDYNMGNAYPNEEIWTYDNLISLKKR